MTRDLDKRRARRILLIQLMISLLIGLGGMLLAFVWGMSLLLGGLIAVAANGIFALGVFAPYRAQNPGRLTLRFFGAEFGKLLFIALAFAVVFIWLSAINPALLLVGFFLVQVLPAVIAHWLTE